MTTFTGQDMSKLLQGEAEEQDDQSPEGRRFCMISTRRGREIQGGQVEGPEVQAFDSRGNGWFRKEAECTDWRERTKLKQQETSTPVASERKY